MLEITLQDAREFATTPVGVASPVEFDRACEIVGALSAAEVPGFEPIEHAVSLMGQLGRGLGLRDDRATLFEAVQSVIASALLVAGVEL